MCIKDVLCICYSCVFTLWFTDAGLSNLVVVESGAGDNRSPSIYTYDNAGFSEASDVKSKIYHLYRLSYSDP